MVPSVDPFVDTRSVPSYVPSVNPPKFLSEEHLGDLQEERRETLEPVKSLENIIASGKIKVYEAAQLRELVIFACCRLTETTLHREKSHSDLRIETKGDDIIK